VEAGAKETTTEEEEEEEEEEEVEVVHTLREGARGVPNVSGGSLAGTDVVRVNVTAQRARVASREVPSPSRKILRAATYAPTRAHNHFLGITVTAISS